ncbi:hypothetical protein ACFL59_06435 [Planctomycetota bacterium]
MSGYVSCVCRDCMELRRERDEARDLVLGILAAVAPGCPLDRKELTRELIAITKKWDD